MLCNALQGLDFFKDYIKKTYEFKRWKAGKDGKINPDGVKVVAVFYSHAYKAEFSLDPSKLAAITGDKAAKEKALGQKLCNRASFFFKAKPYTSSISSMASTVRSGACSGASAVASSMRSSQQVPRSSSASIASSVPSLPAESDRLRSKSSSARASSSVSDSTPSSSAGSQGSCGFAPGHSAIFGSYASSSVASDTDAGQAASPALAEDADSTEALQAELEAAAAASAAAEQVAAKAKVTMAAVQARARAAAAAEKERQEAEAKVAAEAAVAAEKARKEADEKARLEVEEMARKEAEEKERLEVEEMARLEADEKARLEEEEKVRQEAEAKAVAEAAVAAEKARKEAEEKSRKEAEEKARLEAEEKVREEAKEKARLEAEAAAKAQADAIAKAEADANAQGGHGSYVLGSSASFGSYANMATCARNAGQAASPAMAAEDAEPRDVQQAEVPASSKCCDTPPPAFEQFDLHASAPPLSSSRASRDASPIGVRPPPPAAMSPTEQQSASPVAEPMTSSTPAEQQQSGKPSAPDLSPEHIRPGATLKAIPAPKLLDIRPPTRKPNVQLQPDELARLADGDEARNDETPAIVQLKQDFDGIHGEKVAALQKWQKAMVKLIGDKEMDSETQKSRIEGLRANIYKAEDECTESRVNFSAQLMELRREADEKRRKAARVAAKAGQASADMEAQRDALKAQLQAQLEVMRGMRAENEELKMRLQNMEPRGAPSQNQSGVEDLPPCADEAPVAGQMGEESLSTYDEIWGPVHHLSEGRDPMVSLSELELRGGRHNWSVDTHLPLGDGTFGLVVAAVQAPSREKVEPRFFDRHATRLDDRLSNTTHRDMDEAARRFEDGSVVKYAVKIFKKHRGTKSTPSQECKKEVQIYTSGSIQALAQGDGRPYLICMVDWSIKDGFIVYELAGRPLSCACRIDADDESCSHLCENEGSLLTTQLLDALALLHSHGILHQDLKLDNIMWADRSAGHRFYETAARIASGEDLQMDPGIIKIIDFGMAKTAVHPVSKTQELRVSGTPDYWPPELARLYLLKQEKKQAYLDLVDAWAIGVIVFELLTTESPWKRMLERRGWANDDTKIINRTALMIFNYGIPRDDVNEWFVKYDEHHELLKGGMQMSRGCCGFLNALLKRLPPDRYALLSNTHKTA